MKIQVNNGIITSYAIIGDLENSIEIDDDKLPNNFIEDYVSGYFQYNEKDKKIEENPNYSYIEETDYTDIKDDNETVKTNSSDFKKVISLLSILQKKALLKDIQIDTLTEQNKNLTRDIMEIKKELKGDDKVE